jgi:hypothetical protein
MGDHPWRVGQQIDRMHKFGFQPDFLLDITTISDFAYFPGCISHDYLHFVCPECRACNRAGKVKSIPDWGDKTRFSKKNA